MNRFDITGPLPEGPMLLEASAGTGKTWTIAGLAARFVAEAGVDVHELLLITFSNAAATELRGRIHGRFDSIAADLETHLSGQSQPQKDPVTARLLQEPQPETCLRRLRRALDDFGTASIATIHSFCQAQLEGLGMLGDWDGAEKVTADVSALIRQCASDEYLARFLNSPAPPLDARRALQVATTAAPSHLPFSAANPEQLEYHEAVRRRFTHRRRQLGLVSFDDLPGRLRRLVQDEQIGEQVRQELRRRFPVVLVDEFQDTDPAQWEILKHTFITAGASITLIGDPKQSIYGFRSADLRCYIEARDLIGHRATLSENHRSEPEVTAGITELFGNAHLGEGGVQVTPVDSGYGDQSRLMLPGAPAARVWLRGHGPDTTPDPERTVTEDVIAHARGLLAGAFIRDSDGGEHPLRPQDIAILTRTRERGLALVAELRSAGLPVAWHGPSPTQESAALADWLAVLAAVAQPTRAHILEAGLGNLLGCDALALLAGGDEAPGSRRVHELAAIHERGGVAALTGELLAGLRPRLAGHSDGNDTWTGLALIGELLLSSGIQDLDALQAWLARRAQIPGELPSRLASDQPAIRVGTMHSAKGLEFPVVLLPQVSVTELNLRTAFPYVNASGERVLHVGERPGVRDELTAIARRQGREEELRLLYVGLSRARHLAIAWHVMDRRATAGPLTALLCRDRSVPELRPEYPRLPTNFGFGPLVHLSSVLSPAWGAELPPRPKEPSQRPLERGVFDREIDQAWRRTSYTGLTSGLHENAPDEPEELDLIPDELTGPMAEPSPMNGLPAGALFGTLVHEVLEQLDWGQPGSIAQVASARAIASGLDPHQAQLLSDALEKVITTPLGGLFEGSLSDLPVSCRLSELDFDLPLGDRGSAALVADLAQAMRHHLAAGDPLASYPARLLATPAAETPLRGFLTGSIDAVLRLPEGGFAVVDYKTNRLPVLPEQELAVGHYSPAAMAEAMMQAHYPLQALLYCAALHRYLEWRLPGYDPELHLGGVGYLFVRGMAGPGTPELGGERCGVFEWYPPAALVTEVSELLGGHHA